MYVKNSKLQNLEDELQDLLTFHRDNGEKLNDSFSVKVNSVDKTVYITLTRKSQPFYEKIAGKPYDFYWIIIRKAFNQMDIEGFNKLVVAANFENIHNYDWQRQNTIDEETGIIIPNDLDIIKKNIKNSLAVFSAIVITTFSISLILSPSFRVFYLQMACSNNIVFKDSSICKK